MLIQLFEIYVAKYACIHLCVRLYLKLKGKFNYLLLRNIFLLISLNCLGKSSKLITGMSVPQDQSDKFLPCLAVAASVF